MNTLYAYVSDFALHDVIIANDRGELASLTPDGARAFAAELIERADYAEELRDESEAMPRE